ncbi:MAG: hypothetical protein PHE78_07950 [Candidatus Gastranaerophilales bacterium]|nr:hypothetical protein [Candidatus Gastranaerophilales bacterium]
MRASQVNNNTNFSGKTRFIPTKSFDWMSNLDGTHQRIILGGTALVTQPVIDYYNPMADEKTRKFSVLKTVIKIVVGTVVGTSVRHVGMMYARKVTKGNKFLEKIKNPALKKDLTKIFSNEKDKKNFIGNFGTILGLMGVIVADFTFDMPLAKAAIDIGTKMFGLSKPDEKGGKK